MSCPKNKKKIEGKCRMKYGFKNISVNLFGTRATIPQILFTSISVIAGGLTIVQNVAPKSFLSIAISENITKSPTNLFMLFLGVLLFFGGIYWFFRMKKK